MSTQQKPDDIETFVQDVLEQLDNGVPWTVIKTGRHTKAEIYTALLQNIDTRTQGEVDTSLLSEPPKDRLFEVLMSRFDILNEHRQAYKTLFFETFKSPALFRQALPLFHQSMELMLQLADLNGRDDNACPPLRVGGLALVYLNSIRIWLNDDSEDMAATMAELDNGLSKVDMAFERMPSFLKSFI